VRLSWTNLWQISSVLRLFWHLGLRWTPRLIFWIFMYLNIFFHFWTLWATFFSVRPISRVFLFWFSNPKSLISTKQNKNILEKNTKLYSIIFWFFSFPYNFFAIFFLKFKKSNLQRNIFFKWRERYLLQNTCQNKCDISLDLFTLCDNVIWSAV
jgi:hypothetical protein